MCPITSSIGCRKKSPPPLRVPGMGRKKKVAEPEKPPKEPKVSNGLLTKVCPKCEHLHLVKGTRPCLNQGCHCREPMP